MLLNEVIQKVSLSKRAVKYYEEQGLLQVEKDSNGYRNYSPENLTTLKEISVYRKLGISISDIRKLLTHADLSLLYDIYEQKASALSLEQGELLALKEFIDTQNVDTVYSAFHYETIAQALQDMIPGWYGYYFMNHFMPYLQIPLTTDAQRTAYQNILSFWDNTTIRIPVVLSLSSRILSLITPKPTMEAQAKALEKKMQSLLNPTEAEYKKLCTQIKQSAKLRGSLLYKYHPSFVAQRKMMRELQDKGYNDIFIPNMKALSPAYRAYHDALTSINDRVCQELGLFYDSNFNLVLKKDAE